MKNVKINSTKTKLEFNTGVNYTKEGQIIRSTLIKTKEKEEFKTETERSDIIFNDISRGIYGLIKNCPLDVNEIYHRYLHNDYNYPSTEQMQIVYEMDKKDRNIDWTV